MQGGLLTYMHAHNEHMCEWQFYENVQLLPICFKAERKQWYNLPIYGTYASVGKVSL